MKKIAVFFVVLLFATAFVNAQNTAVISYSVAMTASGWGPFVSSAEQAGQPGQRRQAEALRVRINQTDIPGTVRFRVHAGGSWSEWKYNNDVAGVIGQNKPIEAIQVELTGDLDDRYDVQYMVFQNNAWTPWVANGVDAGVFGQRRFVEAVQIILTENKAGRRPAGGRRAPPPPPPPPPAGGGGRR